MAAPISTVASPTIAHVSERRRFDEKRLFDIRLQAGLLEIAMEDQQKVIKTAQARIVEYKMESLHLQEQISAGEQSQKEFNQRKTIAHGKLEEICFKLTIARAQLIIAQSELKLLKEKETHSKREQAQLEKWLTPSQL